MLYAHEKRKSGRLKSQDILFYSLLCLMVVCHTHSIHTFSVTNHECGCQVDFFQTSSKEFVFLNCNNFSIIQNDL
jgi:hypothetical protein